MPLKFTNQTKKKNHNLQTKERLKEIQNHDALFMSTTTTNQLAGDQFITHQR